MQIPPIDVIMSWPTPNYQNPITRGNALLALIIVFSVLVFLAISGRFYSRVILKHWFGADDCCIFIAFIFTIAMNVVVVLANRKFQWNRHIWDVEYSNIQNASIMAFTAKLLFVEAATFTRMSLICFYYRLVRDSGIGCFTNILHASMAFVISLGIAFTCVGIWLCVPVQAYWVFPPLEDHKCMDEGTTVLVVGIWNCVADLLTTILPIPLVWRLQMPLKHRVGVCILLGLGFIVTVAGALRTYFIWQSLIYSWDETWYSYPLWICATIEIDVAVICACAPALKPLLHKPLSIMTSALSSKLSGKSGGSSRSPTASRGTLSSSTNAKFSLFGGRHSPFCARKPSHPAQDSVWDGDEEYGMLQLSHPDKACVVLPSVHSSAVHITADNDGEYQDGGNGDMISSSWPMRKSPRLNNGVPRRQPTLEIMKRQSVDQEVSYLTQERSGRGGGGGGVSMMGVGGLA